MSGKLDVNYLLGFMISWRIAYSFCPFGHCLGAYSTRVGGGGSPESTTGESTSGSAETSRVSGGLSIEGYMLIKGGKGRTEKKKDV